MGELMLIFDLILGWIWVNPPDNPTGPA